MKKFDPGIFMSVRVSCSVIIDPINKSAHSLLSVIWYVGNLCSTSYEVGRSNTGIGTSKTKNRKRIFLPVFDVLPRIPESARQVSRVKNDNIFFLDNFEFFYQTDNVCINNQQLYQE